MFVSTCWEVLAGLRKIVRVRHGDINRFGEPLLSPVHANTLLIDGISTQRKDQYIIHFLFAAAFKHVSALALFAQRIKLTV